MNSNLFNKRSWHFKRFVESQGITLSPSSFVDLHVRSYVSQVINSLLKTYVFNGSLLITLIFLIISLDKIVEFFVAHWLLVAISFAVVCVKENEFLQIVFQAYTKPHDTFVSVHN